MPHCDRPPPVAVISTLDIGSSGWSSPSLLINSNFATIIHWGRPWGSVSSFTSEQIPLYLAGWNNLWKRIKFLIDNISSRARDRGSAGVLAGCDGCNRRKGENRPPKKGHKSCRHVKNQLRWWLSRFYVGCAENWTGCSLCKARWFISHLWLPRQVAVGMNGSGQRFRALFIAVPINL